MSVMCLQDDCRKCRWSVDRGGKLDCNFNDRLGLGKPEITRHLEEGVEMEKVEEEKK